MDLGLTLKPRLVHTRLRASKPLFTKLINGYNAMADTEWTPYDR
ncbi:hypothetical protein [Rhizobium grahamii]|nr:hypothetical protein [Rhizobium grahamii]